MKMAKLFQTKKNCAELSANIVSDLKIPKFTEKHLILGVIMTLC